MGVRGWVSGGMGRSRILARTPSRRSVAEDVESTWEDDRRASIESRPEGLKVYPWLGGLANVAWVESWASKAEMECTSGNEMVSTKSVSVDIGTVHRFV